MSDQPILVSGKNILIDDMITIGGLHYFVTKVDSIVNYKTVLELLYIDIITKDQTPSTLAIPNDLELHVRR